MGTHPIFESDFDCLTEMSDLDMIDDEDEYDLVYSEDSNSEPDVDLENQYYNAKSQKDDDPDAALSGFSRVLELEEEKGEWGFKALKQQTKINFRLERYNDMLDSYRKLLGYIKNAVTRNYSEKSINSILDYISSAKQLNQSCLTQDGEEDQKKGTQLLEIIQIDIQMSTIRKDNKKLKQLYEKSKAIKSAIPHPLTKGIIHECGGKMHLAEELYNQAHTDFFEAFKCFDEAGSPRRISSLKYLVLANMLSQSDINPFDSQEAKPYKSDPEIQAMTELREAYQNNDIDQFERILRDRQLRQAVMGDPFIREHIESLLKLIRTQVLVKLIKPYTRVKLSSIACELKIEENEVESLLVTCIVDGQIKGKINQSTGILVMEKKAKAADERYAAIFKWGSELIDLQKSLESKIS